MDVLFLASSMTRARIRLLVAFGSVVISILGLGYLASRSLAPDLPGGLHLVTDGRVMTLQNSRGIGHTGIDETITQIGHADGTVACLIHSLSRVHADRYVILDAEGRPEREFSTLKDLKAYWAGLNRGPAPELKWVREFNVKYL